MTAPMTVVEELRQRVAALETRVRDLEATVVQNGTNGTHKPAPPKPTTPRSIDEALAAMRAEGFIRAPLPEELAHAAAWDALPEEEKKAIEEELRQLKLDPLLSDIIIMNRARHDFGP